MALFVRTIFAACILAFMPTGTELSTRSHAEIYTVRVESIIPPKGKNCAILERLHYV